MSYQNYPEIICSPNDERRCYELAGRILSGIGTDIPLRNLYIKWSSLNPTQRDAVESFMEKEGRRFFYVAIRAAMETWTIMQDTEGASSFVSNFINFTRSPYVNSRIYEMIGEISNKVDSVCSGSSHELVSRLESTQKTKLKSRRAPSGRRGIFIYDDGSSSREDRSKESTDSCVDQRPSSSRALYMKRRSRKLTRSSKGGSSQKRTARSKSIRRNMIAGDTSEISQSTVDILTNPPLVRSIFDPSPSPTSQGGSSQERTARSKSIRRNMIAGDTSEISQSTVDILTNPPLVRSIFDPSPSPTSQGGSSQERTARSKSIRRNMIAGDTSEISQSTVDILTNPPLVRSIFDPSPSPTSQDESEQLSRSRLLARRKINLINTEYVPDVPSIVMEPSLMSVYGTSPSPSYQGMFPLAKSQSDTDGKFESGDTDQDTQKSEQHDN